MRLQRRALFLALFFTPFLLLSQKINPDYLKNIKIRSIGPAAMSGRITALACDPSDPYVIYAGAASGGVWRSKSGGANWEPIFDKAPTQSVGALAVSSRNPDEIWVGTGEGNPRNSQNFGAGIFRSIDGGANWINMGLERTRTIHRILLHRDNPDVIWAASLGSAYGPNEERGVFKSSDGGRSWRKVLYVNDLTGCADLVVDPRNPNKLVAAMWEYRRWPWFFKSGGKGSGIYVSYDGGESWERRSNKDGLPEGDLGRVGLAIAPSNPDVVYALVEAKDNALYKSVDGGRKWRKMAEKNQGDRPFYYAEIYADPKNENIVYSVHSQITRSIDGGRSFDNWVGFWDIHPDHHAFWIHPENPGYIIDGNDGGLNITHDGGKTWRYADNIPVGQFYHINVDNDIPYNIYGGLQDNGSWVGPSAAWKASGLRNTEWQEVDFGDGFDVLPQRDNIRYCFAMSQGGELSHIDRKTGKSRYVKPLHPDGTYLRWNWNAGIAQDPFRDHGIYFGSQFLHYSPDLGHTWQIISPDLTTNDTSKFHQSQSGGLTLDATNAENFCTIIALAPSPAQQGVIWVGTDDGNLQLTRDGGKNWDNVADRMPDCPKGAWIPQIDVSAKNAGEAFVVVNNYRQNDWEPYLYHTTDFGRKWKRLAHAKNINGFCLSVVQDSETPNLLFLGTDQGLYFSLDYGENWTHWPAASFPSCPVQDMKIQSRDGDLVIGTFGRAIWILDNIQPLREMAKAGPELLAQPFKIFKPQDAVLAAFASYSGPRFSADETFHGENKRPFARIPVWVKPGAAANADKTEKADKKKEEKADAKGKGGNEAPKKDKATVIVMSVQGDTLRRFKTELDTGFNAINWYLDTKGVRFPSNNEPDKDQFEPGGGPLVPPGEYTITVAYGASKDSTTIRVIDDPRLDITPAARRAQADAKRAFYKTVERAQKSYNRLKDVEKTIKLVEDQLVNVPDSTKKDLNKRAGAIRDSISSIKDRFFPQKEPKGIQRNPDNLNGYFFRAMEYIDANIDAPNAQARIAIDKATRETDKVVGRINDLLDKDWKEYRALVEAMKYSLFKDFEKL